METVERTEDVIVNGDVAFEGLMLSQKTLQGLKTHGFDKPSPIQLTAIPLGKCGFDLIVEAKSGTGKTAVFAIIALEMLLDQSSNFQVLILAPTREIAAQIGDVIRKIGTAHKDLRVEIVMGGTNINDDVSRLKNNKFQILVGSPGRILHLIKLNAISTKSVRLFVLDEADRLMEDSFQKDVNYIYSQLPERKQSIAASATYTPELKEFLHRYMQTPSHIMPYSSSVLLGVSQKICAVPVHGSSVRQNKIKSDKLLEILSRVPFKQCLVFCRYQVRAQTMCDLLSQEGWPVKYLASSQKQVERLDSLKKLQDFSCRILVATDLAARGIDATNVDLVINLDAPENIATYLHRIGRSGRYGSKGTAITIVVAGEEETNFVNMLKSLGECNLTKFEHEENTDSLPEQNSDLLNEQNSDLLNEQNPNCKLEQNSDDKPEFRPDLSISDPSAVKDSDSKQRNSLISLKNTKDQKLNPEPSPVQFKCKPELVLAEKENFSPELSLKKEPALNGKTPIENKIGDTSKQLDLVTLMSFTPNENVYEAFEDIENSLEKYLGEKKTCNTTNFKYENYINEKNSSVLYFLDHHIDIEDLNTEIFNGDRTPLILKRYPRQTQESDDYKSEKDIVCDNEYEKQIFNEKILPNVTENINLNQQLNSSESSEESSEDFSDCSNSDYVEDESENEGLNEYIYFKKRLENVCNQIQHSVYISTLLNNYKG